MWAVKPAAFESPRRRLLGALAAGAWLLSPTRGVAQPRARTAPAPPVYPTRIPPPMRLQYTLRRGMLSGQGELTWRPDGERYEAQLRGTVAGLPILTQVSRGGFDAAGLAPLRFSDQRLRRAPKLANFERRAGRITFSDARDEYPLVEGSQDRLSWMIQLAAIAAARPQEVRAGAHIAMFVVGSRGDGQLWSFAVLGSEPVAVAGGTVSAIKLAREAREPDDTEVEVWLDAARQWLPVRARLTTRPDGDSLELVLESAQALP